MDHIFLENATNIYSAQADIRTIIVSFNKTSVNITGITSDRDYTVTVNVVIINYDGVIIQGPNSTIIRINGTSG